VTGRLKRWRQSFRGGSAGYWQDRYAGGGDSGAGSYGGSATRKADYLNRFVAEHGVSSVLELGCGDGNQLSLARYPRYVGYDVSENAVDLCRRRFAGDPTKSFQLVSELGDEHADLALSLDVVYHLVEDAVFDQHMRDLFAAADRFAIVFASNTDKRSIFDRPHVRHRRFTDWVESSASEWELYEPSQVGRSHRGAEFYAYARAGSSG